jgi:hypothetical protein
MLLGGQQNGRRSELKQLQIEIETILILNLGLQSFSRSHATPGSAPPSRGITATKEALPYASDQRLSRPIQLDGASTSSLNTIVADKL